MMTEKSLEIPNAAAIQAEIERLAARIKLLKQMLRAVEKFGEPRDTAPVSRPAESETVAFSVPDPPPQPPLEG